MANVIIGIHGLGNKPPAALLEKWWILAMKEGLKNGNYKRYMPFFELVYWSDIIHPQPLDPQIKDRDNKLFIEEPYTEAPEDFPAEDYSIRKKIVDYLGRQMNRIFLNEDLSLNYSFISDAIINRYFRDLEVYYSDCMMTANGKECSISEMIRERLASKLRAHRNDNIMLIGHSMGSIIAFDVLSYIVPEIKIGTFITIGSPLGLPVVISKIAAEHYRRAGLKKPVRTPPGITGNWYNFSDILDKVAFNYRISEQFPENEHGVKPVDLLVTNKYIYNGERNPHKSFGYLRTPEFSRVLNEFTEAEKTGPGKRILHRMKESFRNIRSRISPDEKV
ncbi:MAG TPA: hypothetical protein P5180_11985 [Bacteroidales bacterium]|nr:hypothetical protein [Bacteroidales bacterium]